MRTANLLLSALAIVAAAAIAPRAAQSAPDPVVIYALEFEYSRVGERVVLLADAPIEARVLELSSESMMLGIEGAVLDPSVNRLLEPVRGSVVERVSALERGGFGRREVRVVIDRRASPDPTISASNRALVIEFPRPELAQLSPLKMEFRDADLEEVVQAVARITGVPYIFGDQIAGSVTILVYQPVSRSEAAALLDAALLMKGYAAVPIPGRGRKIVPIAGATAPWQETLGEEGGGEFVTTLLHLEAADVESMLTALRPLLGTHTMGFAHEPSNSLILAGSAARLERLRNAVRALDTAEAERTLIWRIQHRPAEDVARELREAFDENVVIDVEPDDRLNAVVLRARSSRVVALREFVDRVDRPVIGRGVLHVLPVRHIDADQLAKIINDLRSGTSEPRSAGQGSLAGRTFSIAVDRPTHSIVVRADPETAGIIDGVVAELDRVPAQIRINATVAEVSTGTSLALGFDYFLPLTSPESINDPIAVLVGNPSGESAGSGNLVAAYTRAPLLIPITDALGNVTNLQVPRESFAITADQREIMIRMLMNPTLLVSSGDEHEIFAGNNVPIPIAQTDATNPLQVRQNVQREDVGLLLRARPTVGQEGGVRLELDVEVSAVSQSLAGDSERVGPMISERTLQTTVHLDDGVIAVVGYATLPRHIERVIGVPFLRSLPILGFLFRTTTETRLDTTLLISVQAEVEREETLELTRALRRELEALTPEVAAPPELP
jgi:general secretion pathway protein D